ncbi:hypothetical protein NLG97_g2651 [Lecanicillium saksenae]|uniref:Uncharacterized protein n=1 Tax=Lecanicillium saksenae TaxID=468837 RepID=A0ACC1R2Z9_9HYPO|nr:hypothetical protein NLG97_g2651 [Lecanicillium saksenae]
MRNDHGIVIEDDERPAKKALQQSLEVAFSRAEGMSRAILARDEQSILRNTIDLDAFYEAQIQLITRRRLPLNCVSWPEYQALLCAVNPRADEVLIQSGNTALAHIERSYAVHRENIKAQLRAAKSQIHFSIDLWSSPHCKAFLGICGQWVDVDYRPRQALLGLPNMQHSHSGEAMAQHLVNTVRYFNIAGNVGYFTSDNATANDTCLWAVATALQPNLASEWTLPSAVKEALSAAIHEADHGIEVTVAESLQRQLRQKTGRALGIDNATRWNSWYMLLRTALEKRDKLMVFQQEHHRALGEDTLTQEDWDVLRLTADFLQPFWQATLAEERKWSSLDQLLYHMDILLKHFEDTKKTYSNNRRLVHSIYMGWFILDKYYFKTDETPVYLAALLLHPSKRLKYLRQNWQRDWHANAISKAQ